MEKFKKIQRIIKDAEVLSGLHQSYQESISRSDVDKYGIGFNHDTRFTLFSSKVCFTAHTGVYGSSSCSTFGSVRDPKEVESAFTAWLNDHQEEILKGISDKLQEKARNSLGEVKAEVEGMTKFISQIEQGEIL